MGLAAFNVAASVNLITAQRLVRRLCAHCKRPADAVQKELFFRTLNEQGCGTPPEDLRVKASVYTAVGCDACDKGYKGRIGLYQVMTISDAMQVLIMRDSDTQALAAQAALEGVRTLRQAGWLKVLQGVTSIEEVLALTPHG